tara:strand:+ start:368 stop:982 length:615 start_codon:yes stop_codon:yes gene_type:complete
MAIEHNSIGAGEIHEPKGAATALSGNVYVADGAGSGVWGSGFTQSIEDFNHAGVALTPAAATKTKVLNDAAGAFTNTAYKIPGRANTWVPASNHFDWAAAGLVLGDSVDIRFDFTVTTSGANDDVVIGLDVGVGSPGPYSLEVNRREWRLAGTYAYTTYYGIYMGDSNTLDFPTEVTVTAGTGSDTILCNGWYVRTSLQKSVLV